MATANANSGSSGVLGAPDQRVNASLREQAADRRIKLTLVLGDTCASAVLDIEPADVASIASQLAQSALASCNAMAHAALGPNGSDFYDAMFTGLDLQLSVLAGLCRTLDCAGSGEGRRHD
ncbi:hypothetical protein [Pseudomonas sp. CGJS7]|uniref:hypothetical protein n=1 Tax=Pseudomonas sp. CGJS7 TaxID=3109348 RepID=UPI00300A53F6